MRARDRLLTGFLMLLLFVQLAPATAHASDRSFSRIVKHVQSNYKAKRQGFFGMVTFGRFLVKLIRPAGVKNFKVVMLKELDFSRHPTDAEFSSFVRSAVDPQWRPLMQFTSRRGRQWSYAYVQHSGDHVKMLIATVQQREAYVVQFKFDPDRLVKFIDNPSILGISLKGDQHNRAEGADQANPNKGANDEADPAKKKDSPATPNPGL